MFYSSNAVFNIFYLKFFDITLIEIVFIYIHKIKKIISKILINNIKNKKLKKSKNVIKKKFIIF